MSNIFKKVILLTFIAFTLINSVKATHMVGGDFSYRSLGKGSFEITLTIRRDCQFGADDAFFDNRAIIAVFDQNGTFMKEIGHRGGFFLDYVGNDTLNESLNIECGVLGAPVCVHEAIYRDTIYLPRPKVGEKYILVYQRCCRNQTLLNINSPLETGGSYILEIDQYAYDERNNSPRFKKWPNIYICANQSLHFDHSAYENEGDSLVYKLYTPSSGAEKNYPMPTVENPARYTPVYNTVSWANGYSLVNMLGGTDALKINSKTGLITGTPTIIGQFLVGVLVEEYRNGKLISVVRRDFEYNVRPCVPPPVADFQSLSAICGSTKVDTLFVINKSQYADSFLWKVYSHASGNTFTYTSKDLNFIYTLPASGKDTFDIYLEAYSKDANCSDNITKQVIAIEDPLLVDFDYKVIECADDKVLVEFNDKFDDLNESYTFKENKWTLIYGSTTITGSGKKVSFQIPKFVDFYMTLEIFTEEKCENRIEKHIKLNLPNIEFISNPVIVCRGETAKIVKNPNSSWTYTWNPTTGLTFNGNDKSNPTFIGDNSRTYNVTVTDGICFEDYTVNVKVKDYFNINIEGPDTVCVNNITLVANGVPVNENDVILQWSNKSDFSTILKEGNSYNVVLNQIVNKFYLRVKPNTGCSNNIDSITIYNGSFKLNFDDKIKLCYKNHTIIDVGGNIPGMNLTYIWEANPIIISDLNKSEITVYAATPGEYKLYFTAKSQFGCEYRDTVFVKFDEGGGELTIDKNRTCETYEMTFSVVNAPVIEYYWEITNADGQVIKFTTSSPHYNFTKPGKYHVYAEVKVQGCDGIIIIEDDVVVTDIIKLSVDVANITFCEGENVELNAKLNLDGYITWFNQKGEQIGVGEKINYKPNKDEIITVIGKDEFECSDTAKIKLFEYKFDLQYNNPGVVCKGDTITLEIKNKTTNNLKYSWAGNNIISGASTNIIKVIADVNTTYSVTITDLEMGCDTILSVALNVSTVDVSIQIETDTVVITNSVTVEVFNVPINSTIIWSTGETNTTKITFTPLSTPGGVFSYVEKICVTVIDQYGCEDKKCIEVTVIDPRCIEGEIYFPNAFSPNKDGANDYFRPRGKYIRNIEMEIYSRWGELLYKGSGDKNLSWDGKSNNKELTPDTYTYRILVQCQDNDNFSKVSNVSLIK